MTIFVDNMAAKFGAMLMSRMIADSSAELFAMADKIGIARKWVQDAGTADEHFDISKAMRAKVVRRGARQITMQQLSAMLLVRRKIGVLCDPVNAEDQAKATMRRWAGCTRCGKPGEAHVDGDACGAREAASTRELAGA